MTNIVLPTERRKATDYNPRLMVLFGKPKCGKSTLMASLDSNLIIDLEDVVIGLWMLCVFKQEMHRKSLKLSIL